MAHLQGLGQPLHLSIPAEGKVRFQPSPSSLSIEIEWTPEGLLMTTPDMARTRVYGGYVTGDSTALLHGGSVITIEHRTVEVIIDDDDLFTRAVESGGWSVRGIGAVSSGRHTAVRRGKRGTLAVEDATWPAPWLAALRRDVAGENVRRGWMSERASAWPYLLMNEAVDAATLRRLLGTEAIDLPGVLATTRYGAVLEHASGMSWMRVIERLSLEQREPDAALRHTVARAVVGSMMMAERAPPPDPYTLVLTWDGSVHCLRRPLTARIRTWQRFAPRISESLRWLRSRSTDAFLDGLEWLDNQLFDVVDHLDISELRVNEDPDPVFDIDSDRARRRFDFLVHSILHSDDGGLQGLDGPGLSRADMAAFMRGLFPDEWSAEERRREQLEILSLHAEKRLR